MSRSFAIKTATKFESCELISSNGYSSSDNTPAATSRRQSTKEGIIFSLTALEGQCFLNKSTYKLIIYIKVNSRVKSPHSYTSEGCESILKSVTLKVSEM